MIGDGLGRRIIASSAPDNASAPDLVERALRYGAGVRGGQSLVLASKALALLDPLAAVGADHTVETYPAKHGWVLRDTPVYDEACCERHWRTLTRLFDDVLQRDAAG